MINVPLSLLKEIVLFEKGNNAMYIQNKLIINASNGFSFNALRIVTRLMHAVVKR